MIKFILVKAEWLQGQERTKVGGNISSNQAVVGHLHHREIQKLKLIVICDVEYDHFSVDLSLTGTRKTT